MQLVKFNFCYTNLIIVIYNLLGRIVLENGKKSIEIGIDTGTFSVKAVVVSEKNILLKEEIPHKNKVKEETVKLLEKIQKELKTFEKEYDISKAKISCTGLRSHLLNLNSGINETKALYTGAEILYPQAESIIALGAQKTYYINLQDKSNPVVMKNTNCSAGTGSFFEEQSGRLQIKLEDISSMVKDAKSIPRIAGRCSVFSKTDMIHHMQEGTPTADILLGLCYSMVRNYRTSILHNKEIEKPVLLTGGVMKNAGVIQALKQELKIEDKDIISNENENFIQAFGAVEADTENLVLTFDELESKISEVTKSNTESQFEPLYKYTDPSDKPEFTLFPYNPEYKHYMGIDIGSTSINVVVINELKQMVYYSYVRTLGKPLEIVQNEIKVLKEKIPGIKLTKSAVTGSGREYISSQIGADLVINEITAQTEGAVLSKEFTDTIFEIGGQDSKYMAVENGQMKDFEMNKVCAAGTGAFLEEQIRKLGISMQEFLDYAMKSQHPVALGDRCTVFIEGSIYRALSEGQSMEDVCAGLAYAICSNYLNRVVNQKKIGEAIAVQGGIAYNQAVICAFRALTKKKIHVTPYFAVTGALGAASLCMNSEGLVFDKEKNRLLNARLLQKSEESYLKDYTPPARNGKKVVGIPRVIFLHKMFPLFNTMFKKLGYEVLISPLSNNDIVSKASDYATAEVCYPIKLIYGHIEWLLEQGVDIILLPRLYTIKHEGSVARKDYACMYMQTSPLLMEQAFHFKERGVQLIMPELSLQFGKKFMLNSILSIGKQLGIPKPFMIPAAVSGFSNLVKHSARLEVIGEESLKGDEPIFVLISRVYNIADPILNMGIEEHLNSIGCRVVHLEHLHASVMHVEHDYPDLYWPFGQHILTGLKIIKANPNMYPIYITNHGCGPDTAIQHFFQNEMAGRDYLHLEVDEHTSKVGVITRLEAFLYSLKSQKTEGEDKIVYGNHKCDGCNSCSDAKVQPDVTHFEKILIPDYGIYSDIIEKVLRKENKGILLNIEKVQPLVQHKNFIYAMNKEYYTFLTMMEELLNTVKKGVSYVMVAPVDEGSEVFGQYALLCQKELVKRGFDVTLHHFYIEDIIKRSDYVEIYKMMLEKEKSVYQKSDNRKKILALGEPLCIYKNFNGERNLKLDKNIFAVNRIPYSEILLFHMMEIDRKHQFTAQINEWKKLHDEIMTECKESDVYSKMDELFNLAKGKLDFCNGDAAKYRLAKLLSLSKEKTDACVIINSAEENSAIILKQLMDRYRHQINVKTLSFDLDFEHETRQDDFEGI